MSILILNSFELYLKPIPYYQNFIDFITNKKSTASYYSFFDKKTPTDYEIYFFLKSKIKNNDSIFVWGNNAQLYKMTEIPPPGKYVVAYHIENDRHSIRKTIESIRKTKPRFIIIMSYQTNNIPFSLSGYAPKIEIKEALIYERIF